MRTYTRTMIVLVVLAVVLAAAGTVVAGGEFVTAATGAAATLVVLAVGVPTGKWLWEHAGTLGKRLIGLAVVILVLAAVVAGWLSGGGEKLATTMLATPTPTPTATATPTTQPLPLAGEIAAQASAQEAALLWIEIAYGEDETWRDVLKASGGERLVLDMDISPNELRGITKTLGITQTVAVVRNPASMTRYIQNSHNYAVRPLVDGEEKVYLGGVTLSNLVKVEMFSIPPIKIVDGDTKVIDEARIAYVIVHRVISPPDLEIARDTWIVAGMILVSQ
jgi:hypothetical protein